jgi:putative nucleotidyltransferase with HDIG domain
LGSVIPVLVAENPFAIILLVVPLLIGPHLAFKGIRQAHMDARITMEGLANALERRDPYTYRHSIRVTEYSGMMLSQMPQIPKPEAEAILAAAHIHDLGKVGSRDGSLKKPGELTPDERAEIEQHAAVGADIVSRLDAYKPSVPIIRHHHERWDGSGYPDKLAGEAIPLGARVIAVADAFDAMTSDRVYRAALTPEVAFSELRKGAGTQFDPQLVDLFQTAWIAQQRLQPAQQAGVPRTTGGTVQRALGPLLPRLQLFLRRFQAG